MEFGLEKCTMLIMRSGKQQITKAIKLPNQEKNKQKLNARSKGKLQVLGNIGSRQH